MSQSRRSFLKTSALVIASLPFLSRFGQLGGSSALAADAALPLAKETDPQAKALKFCSNADKPKACEPRKAKDKAGQYCYGCQLFVKLEGDKKNAKGKCMIMPKNQVPGSGWCQSWVKNPAVEG